MVFSYRFCCGVPLQLPGPLCLPPAIGSIVMTYAVRNPAQGNEGRVSKGMYSEPTKVRDLGVDGRQLEARAGLGPVSLQAIGLPNGLDGHPRILRGRVVIGGDGPKGVAGCDGAGGGQLLGIGTCTGIEGASGNGHEDHGPQPTPPVYACSFHQRRIKDGQYFPNGIKQGAAVPCFAGKAVAPTRRRGQARRLDCRGAYSFWFVGTRFIQKVVRQATVDRFYRVLPTMAVR